MMHAIPVRESIFGKPISPLFLVWVSGPMLFLIVNLRKGSHQSDNVQYILLPMDLMWHCLLSSRLEFFYLCTLSLSGLNSSWSFTPAHKMELTQKTPYCDPNLFNKGQPKARQELHGAYQHATAPSEKSVTRNSDLYPGNWLHKAPNTGPYTDGVRDSLAYASRL